VTDTCAVVNVVGEECTPCKLLKGITVFVDGTARRLETKRFRPVLFVNLRELLDDQVNGFIPGSIHELAILLDLWCRKPVGALDMFPTGHSLGTELAFIDRGPLVGFYSYQLSVADNKVQSTTNPAIRAGCGYIL